MPEPERPTPNGEVTLITTEEAGLMMVVDPKTVWRYVERGILKGYHVGPRNLRRVSLQSVLEHLANNAPKEG